VLNVEAVIFIGIQATGKSIFFLQQFFATHVRINLDMLKTRNRERILLAACLEAKQPFVIDNTNLTREARAGYISQAKAAGFRVVGYFWWCGLTGAASRASRAKRISSQRPLMNVSGIDGRTQRLKGMPVSEKNELLFQRGINFNDVANWQKRGVGLYWETYGKQAVNQLTGETVVAERRRIKTDYELPMRNEYTRFVLALLDSAAKERDK
jgi:hypothetical protein